MSITIRVRGVEEAVAALGRYEVQKRGALGRAVLLTAIAGEAHVKALISGPGPSMPGNPPGVQTGRLRSSYRHRMTAPLSGEVYTDVLYAPMLEHGTARMSARPHAGPTAEWMAPVFRHRAEDALRS